MKRIGFDVMCADRNIDLKEFSERQTDVLRTAWNNGYPVKDYARPGFSSTKMEEFYKMQQAGIDIDKYINEDMSATDLEKERLKITGEEPEDSPEDDYDNDSKEEPDLKDFNEDVAKDIAIRKEEQEALMHSAKDDTTEDTPSIEEQKEEERQTPQEPEQWRQIEKEQQSQKKENITPIAVSPANPKLVNNSNIIKTKDNYNQNSNSNKSQYERQDSRRDEERNMEKRDNTQRVDGFEVNYLIKEFDNSSIKLTMTVSDIDRCLQNRSGEVEVLEAAKQIELTPDIDLYGTPNGWIGACITEEGVTKIIKIETLIRKMKAYDKPLPIGDTFIKVRKNEFNNDINDMTLYVEDESKAKVKYLLDKTSETYVAKCFSKETLPYVVDYKTIGEVRVIGNIVLPQFRLNYEFATVPEFFDVLKLYYQGGLKEEEKILAKIGPSLFMYACQFGFNREVLAQRVDAEYLTNKYKKVIVNNFDEGDTQVTDYDRIKVYEAFIIAEMRKRGFESESSQDIYKFCLENM